MNILFPFPLPTLPQQCDIIVGCHKEGCVHWIQVVEVYPGGGTKLVRASDPILGCGLCNFQYLLESGCGICLLTKGTRVERKSAMV